MRETSKDWFRVVVAVCAIILGAGMVAHGASYLLPEMQDTFRRWYRKARGVEYFPQVRFALSIDPQAEIQKWRLIRQKARESAMPFIAVGAVIELLGLFAIVPRIERTISGNDRNNVPAG